MEIFKSLSYDDILVKPAPADFLPNQVDTTTRLTRGINLNIPVLSAAMDTVTEQDMAIALALAGGAGVIHRNLEPEEQARQVKNVKRYLNWIIENPVTVRRDTTISMVRKMQKERRISGFPVIDKKGVLCGIITNRDMRFCADREQLVERIMTRNVQTVKKTVTKQQAQEIFNRYKIEKLPVVDNDKKIVGMITVKDMEKHEFFPDAAVDRQGRLLVGAAVSPVDYERRLPLLRDNRVDFVVLDTAHGDTLVTRQAVKAIKKDYTIEVIAGNVADGEAVKRLIDCGADAVKVGIGPGSICTTRIVAGVGMPQFTAVLDSVAVAEKSNIPVVADGGVKFSGDIVKALAAGASSVMLGNLLAGLREAPGEEIIFDGRMFKQYRGMGSLGAIAAGSDRYGSQSGEAAVPEGIEGRIPFKGELRPFVHQLVSGLKKGMFYAGCRDVAGLRGYKKFVRISASGLSESHAHDVTITHEAPNYSRK